MLRINYTEHLVTATVLDAEDPPQTSPGPPLQVRASSTTAASSTTTTIASVPSSTIAAELKQAVTRSLRETDLHEILKRGGLLIPLNAPGTTTIDCYAQLIPGLGHSRTSKPKLIAAGQLHFSAVGDDALLHLKLTKRGAELLRRARKLRITARVSFVSIAQAPITTTVIIGLKR